MNRDLNLLMLIQQQKTALRIAGSVLRKPSAGFTLIELLITIVIASALMVVAVPSFLQFQKNSRLSDTVSSFVSAANTARASAMKTGRQALLVPNDNAIGWNSGWYVYIDADFDETLDAVEEVVSRHEAINADILFSTPSSNSLSGSDRYLLFNGSGYPRMKSGAFGAATLNMSNSLRTTSFVISPAGGVRTCAAGSTGC